jgi:hypothetical protein
VILDENLKRGIQRDYQSFFGSEEVYARLGVPWKRGLIFLGVRRCCLPLGLSLSRIQLTALAPR